MLEVYRDIGTGKKVVENLMKAYKIGDEMYLSFVNNCLIKRKAYFFDPIKKINLGIGVKKIKKIRKVVSAMKEVGKVWGNVGGREGGKP